MLNRWNFLKTGFYEGINVGFTSALMFLSTHDLALLAALLGFSLGMSIFVAFAFSSSSRQALKEVVDGVRLLNAGRLDARVPVRSGDEVSEVASALNSMAERLDVKLHERTCRWSMIMSVVSCSVKMSVYERTDVDEQGAGEGTGVERSAQG